MEYGVGVRRRRRRRGELVATQLVLNNTSVVTSAVSGTVVGTITNKIAGTTLTLVDNAGGRFTLSGTNITTSSVPTNYETSQNHLITLLEVQPNGVKQYSNIIINVLFGFSPILSLDFLAATTLDPSITFSRGSNATLVDATGKLTYAPNNLVTNSEAFDATAWLKTNATVSANTIAAPNDTLTADKLVEDTTASAQHRTNQAVTTTVGTNYTYSIYLKAGERTSVQLRLIGVATFAACTVNLTLGTLSAITGTASITDAGNGWYRVSVNGKTDSTTTTCYANMVVAGSTIYSGDGTSGVFLWGAQLEAVTYQTTPSTYVATTASAYYGPRFDYDPVTLQPKGLLIGEARTNLMFPADGTTGWGASPASSITATANSITSPDGTTNATKLAMGDLTNTGHTWFKTFAGAISTTYVGSVYLKAGEYTRSQVTFGNTAFAATTGALFDLSNGTVVVTAGGSTATIIAVGGGWYLCTVTATSDADGGNYVFGASPKPASVTTIDAVFTPASVGLGGYVYGIQVEAGAFVTTLIPTVTGQVTRSADIAQMTGTNFSSWYNQTQGTFVTQSSNFSTVNFPVVVAISDGTISNRINVFSSPTATNRLSVATGGVTQAEFAFSNYVTGTIASQSLAVKANDFAGSVNGATVQTDTSGTVPSVTQMQLGSQTGGFSFLNGHIRSIRYYNTRLPDAQLQSITT